MMIDETLRLDAPLRGAADIEGVWIVFLFCGAYLLYIYCVYIKYLVLAASVERPTTDVRAVDILKYIYPG
jgi:hypothetical protein